MQTQSFGRLSLLSLILLGSLNFGCSGGGGFSKHNPNFVEPLANPGVTYQVALSSAQISGVISHGVASDGLLHVEIDGQFATVDDVVVFACASSTPSLQITHLDSTAIVVTLAPLDDVCLVTVQEGGVSSAASLPIALSSTATQPIIKRLTDLGPDASDSSHKDLVLTGAFAGGSEQIYSSCDGAAASAIPRAQVLLDEANEVEISLAKPNYVASCWFYVQSSGVQSEPAGFVSISEVASLGIDTAVPGQSGFALYGQWSGVGDQVSMSCDGLPMSVLSGNLIISDNSSSIHILAPTPAQVQSCRFTVQSAGSSSPAYLFGQ